MIVAFDRDRRERSGRDAPQRVKRVIAVAFLAAMVSGCHLYFWSWNSGSGSHELTVPPEATATPAPTPESRY